jgi:hypothetical protein
VKWVRSRLACWVTGSNGNEQHRWCRYSIVPVRNLGLARRNHNGMAWAPVTGTDRSIPARSGADLCGRDQHVDLDKEVTHGFQYLCVCGTRLSLAETALAVRSISDTWASWEIGFSILLHLWAQRLVHLLIAPPHCILPTHLGWTHCNHDCLACCVSVKFR